MNPIYVVTYTAKPDNKKMYLRDLGVLNFTHHECHGLQFGSQAEAAKSLDNLARIYSPGTIDTLGVTVEKVGA